MKKMKMKILQYTDTISNASHDVFLIRLKSQLYTLCRGASVAQLSSVRHACDISDTGRVIVRSHTWIRSCHRVREITDFILRMVIAQRDNVIIDRIVQRETKN